MNKGTESSRIKSQEAANKLKKEALAILSSGSSTESKETPIKLYGMELPPPVLFASIWGSPPELSPEIISGVLRQGHKMMLSGPSKAGKSFALIQLALCVASGKPWLGLDIKKGKVLYVNLELDEKTCYNRFVKVGRKLGVKTASDVTKISDLTIWNLRGFAVPFTELAALIADMVKADNLSMVIVDPIYKVFTGSENDQEAVTAFCNALDLIAKAGASVVYCHHHSKGIQGTPYSMRYTPPEGFSAKRAYKQAQVVAAQFEADCRVGKVLTRADGLGIL